MKNVTTFNVQFWGALYYSGAVMLVIIPVFTAGLWFAMWPSAPRVLLVVEAIAVPIIAIQTFRAKKQFKRFQSQAQKSS